MCLFVCNLCSLQKLPTNDSLFLKARLLHRTELCFQTLQPSKASIFSWPMALHGAVHKPGATGGSAHFLGKVPQPRRFQVHRVAADTPPTPPLLLAEPGSLSWLLFPLLPCSSSSPAPGPCNGLVSAVSSSLTPPSLEPFCKQCCKWWGSSSKTVVKAALLANGFIQRCQWQTRERDIKTCC